jgi:hypothetical protein
MMSPETDLEMHANWKRYTEELTAKDFIERDSNTIPSGEAQGTPWNRIKCKERLKDHPEAVKGQAKINLDSQVWKSLEDSLPNLYWAD